MGTGTGTGTGASGASVDGGRAGGRRTSEARTVVVDARFVHRDVARGERDGPADDLSPRRRLRGAHGGARAALGVPERRGAAEREREGGTGEEASAGRMNYFGNNAGTGTGTGTGTARAEDARANIAVRADARVRWGASI
jgi:hypothetical protein